MLGLLCARPLKPWNISPQTFSLHTHYHQSHSQLTNNVADGASSVSIWRVNVPAAVASGDWRRDHLRPAIHQQRGEGSWNVACDARPARWIHRLDLAYLLYGVCVYLSFNDVVANDGVVGEMETIVGVVNEAERMVSEEGCSDLLDFRVTGGRGSTRK
ncbi:uncharacterized protein LOC110726185 isoform X2 [Chenopodium quinoa]|uniref:uncharacterized protein LOC110726185 isoform X2 n=1 Tax=Chenopodium quinoa TaxID=63459 RepID=UPI000B79A8F8|nr:uncharacterized protein LOC110726185 isoform X2 [Chenopodium quinoa]